MALRPQRILEIEEQIFSYENEESESLTLNLSELNEINDLIEIAIHTKVYQTKKKAFITISNILRFLIFKRLFIPSEFNHFFSEYCKTPGQIDAKTQTLNEIALFLYERVSILIQILLEDLKTINKNSIQLIIYQFLFGLIKVFNVKINYQNSKIEKGNHLLFRVIKCLLKKKNISEILLTRISEDYLWEYKDILKYTLKLYSILIKQINKKRSHIFLNLIKTLIKLPQISKISALEKYIRMEDSEKNNDQANENTTQIQTIQESKTIIY
jgi:hypothetical protein